ncbi:MAG: MBL fold metallo-hydrolase [Desulfobacteraceae bacterium]
MTKTTKGEDHQDPQLEQDAQRPAESQLEEPLHPGWQTLAQVFQSSDQFFERFLYLLGYDYSSNVYVITGDYLTVVDPGNDYTMFMDLFRRGFKPTEVKKIVLTHGHRDHAMGAFEFIRSYPSIIQTGGFELILHQESPQVMKKAITDFGCRFTEVKGGEILELSGLDWEVIYTPGHTIDGITLYHAPSKTAITGDTVLPHAMAEADQNAGGRLDHYLFGVKSLLKKDIANVLPGHGIPVAGLGNQVVEQTYESLMLTVIGVKDQIPWVDGAAKLVQKGLLEEAVFCCDKELSRQPENMTALQLKAFCLIDLNRCQESLELLDKILAQQPDNAHALTGKGQALLGEGKYDDSIEYFDRALQINPNLKEAQIFKGMALYLAGRYDEAMDIEAFSSEFISRFKEELATKVQPPK